MDAEADAVEEAGATTHHAARASTAVVGNPADRHPRASVPAAGDAPQQRGQPLDQSRS